MRLKTFKIGILDRYIIKKFIVTFFVALILIILIVIIFDVSEKIDDFVEKEAPLKAIVFDYYLNFIPYFMNMFSPLFTFITVIFFTSKLAANTEIVAMLAGGVSFKRLMYPYFLSALIIFTFSLSLNLFVIPDANKKRLDFENTYVHEKYVNTNRDMHYQVSPGTYLYAGSFSTHNNTIYKFSLERIEQNEMASKLTAESAQWNAGKASWHLKNYILRDSSTGIETVKVGKELDTAIAITADIFYLKDDSVEAFDRKTLADFIATQKMRGDAMVKYSLMERNNRLSLPFSAFILTLMGVSLSSKKRRGGIGLNLGVGIALSFSYILFMRFSQMFVITDTLPPFVAVWLPNALFAVIACVLYRMAPK